MDFEVEDVLCLVASAELEGIFWEEGTVCANAVVVLSLLVDTRDEPFTWWLVEQLMVWLEGDLPSEAVTLVFGLAEDCCIINHCWRR